MRKLSRILHRQRSVPRELRLNFHWYVCNKFIQLQSKVCVESVNSNVTVFVMKTYLMRCVDLQRITTWAILQLCFDFVLMFPLLRTKCKDLLPQVAAGSFLRALRWSQFVFWTAVCWEIFIYVICGTLLLPSYTCGCLSCPNMQNAVIPCRTEIMEVVPFESFSLCFACFCYWVTFCAFHFKVLPILWVLQFPSSAFFDLNVAYPMGSVFCLRCFSWYFFIR